MISTQASVVAQQLVQGLTLLTKNINSITITPQLLDSLRALANAATLLKQSGESSIATLPAEKQAELKKHCSDLDKSVSVLREAADGLQANAKDEGARAKLVEGASSIAAATTALVNMQEDTIQEDILHAGRACALATKQLYLCVQSTAATEGELVAAAKKFAQQALIFARILQNKSDVIDGADWQELLRDACNRIKSCAPTLVAAAKKAYANRSDEKQLATLKAEMAAMSSAIKFSIDAGSPPGADDGGAGAAASSASAAAPPPAGSPAPKITNPKKGMQVMRSIKSSQFKSEVDDITATASSPAQDIDAERKKLGDEVKAETTVLTHTLRRGKGTRAMSSQLEALEAEDTKTSSDDLLKELGEVEVEVSDAKTPRRRDIPDELAAESGPVTWSTTQVGEWLSKSGFEEFAGPFEENDIDGSALEDVDKEDLKSLGMTKIGVQRRFLKLRGELFAS